MAKILRLSRENTANTIKRGGVIHSPLFTIRYMKNNLTFPRFTVVVASKEENTATGRNSIKRILREVFRYNLAKMPVDLVVFGKKGLKNKDFSEINSNVKRALEDLNL